jgi:ribosomal protein S18 acetylase RimI-like enzyme
MIRQAGRGDLPTLVAFNQAMALETEGLALDPGTLTAGVAAILEGRRPGTYWVHEEGGAILAQLMITFEWSDWRNRDVWWIQSVYVDQKARRRGLYRGLYAHVVEEARRAGAGGIRLYVDSTNKKAQTTYASLGMNGEHYRVFEQMF